MSTDIVSCYKNGKEFESMPLKERLLQVYRDAAMLTAVPHRVHAPDVYTAFKRNVDSLAMEYRRTNDPLLKPLKDALCRLSGEAYECGRTIAIKMSYTVATEMGIINLERCGRPQPPPNPWV